MPLFVTMDVSFGLLGLKYLQKVPDLLGAVFASFIPVSTKAVLSASIAAAMATPGPGPLSLMCATPTTAFPLTGDPPYTLL